MIHEEICTYEVCKLAKEKGFPQKIDYVHLVCSYNYYNHKGELNGSVGDLVMMMTKGEEIPEKMKFIAAPTQSLLQRWLREEKGVIIDVVLDWQYNIEMGEIRYSYRIGGKNRLKNGNIESKGWLFESRFDTYELALEDALKYALENLI